MCQCAFLVGRSGERWRVKGVGNTGKGWKGVGNTGKGCKGVGEKGKGM